MGERRGVQMSLLPELTTEEVERYARHIVLRDIGGPGQRKLKAAHVCVIGAGGLGAPLLLYLAAAGVGTLTIVDDDMVSLSNLQRQILSAPPISAGPRRRWRRKFWHASIRMSAFVARPVRLDQSNVRGADRGLRCGRGRLGQFRHALSRFRRLLLCQKALVTAAVGQFDGSLTTLRPFETGPDGKPNPTYRCLFPQKPPPAPCRPAPRRACSAR